MNPIVVRHFSPRRNRLSIRVRGLIARRTADHNYPEYQKQPVGVYAKPLGGTGWWGGDFNDGRAIDCWQVDATGLRLRPDKVIGHGACYIEEDVPPWRLKLLGQVSGDRGEDLRWALNYAEIDVQGVIHA